jgi:cyclopropane-fatty-acyl-phospholipid synthase
MLIPGLAPSRSRAHARIEELLNLAGVRIVGYAPTDIRVQDPRLYASILAHGSLGLG